ncbi:glutamine--fructose-6-phosphate aminotransferase [Gammaproteobacteria bacterium 53_120_T64]|nr:glutamine--fructose-6-phosphate aminotransferase [Gammaproteobacteria bacterium 53_120_T64]
MCGIFAAINKQSVTRHLIKGLQNLSYRGYDSAGIAIVDHSGLQRRRAEGKIERLIHCLETKPLEGRVGIAHTRWATHGAASQRNAHPHMTSRVAVAHNGIIENSHQLRTELESRGFHFESDTDSETIPQLITFYLNLGLEHDQALRSALERLEGSFAIAAVFDDLPDCIFAARRGSPLALGYANGGHFLASDINALKSVADQACHLEDGDLARISLLHIAITDQHNKRVDRPRQVICEQQSNSDRDKQGFRHYMLKEIHQQAGVIKRTLGNYLPGADNTIDFPLLPFNLAELQRLNIVGCGTSHYAAMIAKYWLEGFAGLAVEVDIASEYRYRDGPVCASTPSLFISQSGETADTLAALRHAKQCAQHCISIVNVVDSSIARESHVILPTMAGAEIGVASTKAFTAQLTVLFLFSLKAAVSRGRINQTEKKRLQSQLTLLPSIIDNFLNSEHRILAIAQKLQNIEHMLYLGRGIALPLALEGALKLKEITYIHAEAYPAGELKHGPIALVDASMPVLVVAPPGRLFAKSLSNLREVSSRGAKVILVSDQQGIDEAQDYIDAAIAIPTIEPLLQPFIYTLALQLLAYHCAVLKGTDIDQPRNLAKSVTVE